MDSDTSKVERELSVVGLVMRVGARDLGFGIATAHQWRQKKAENAKVRCGKREVVAGPLLIHWWTRRYLKSRKQGELH